MYVSVNKDGSYNVSNCYPKRIGYVEFRNDRFHHADKDRLDPFKPKDAILREMVHPDDVKQGFVEIWDFDGEPNYKEGELIALSDMYGIPSDGNEVAAPSLYEAQKWLRNTHNLHISTKPYPCEDGLMWMYETRRFTPYLVCVIKNKTGFRKEEEALSEGVRNAVEILEEK